MILAPCLEIFKVNEISLPVYSDSAYKQHGTYTTKHTQTRQNVAQVLSAHIDPRPFHNIYKKKKVLFIWLITYSFTCTLES